MKIKKKKVTNTIQKQKMEQEPQPNEFVLLNEEPSYILPSNCTILATNISPKATESSLREFFGICGVIKKISLNS